MRVPPSVDVAVAERVKLWPVVTEILFGCSVKDGVATATTLGVTELDVAALPVPMAFTADTEKV